MDEDVLIIVLADLDDLEQLLIEKQERTRTRNQLSLLVWGLIALAALLGLIIAFDSLVVYH